MRGQAIPDPEAPQGGAPGRPPAPADWREALPRPRQEVPPPAAQRPHPFATARDRAFDRAGALSKLWVLWRQLGLDDDARYEFTALFLGLDDGADVSWRTITDDQMCRLIDAVEGFALLSLMFQEGR